MYKLKYTTQNYAWGQDGEQSEVYNLLMANGNSTANPNLPYAELWLGTHVSGPSFIEMSKKSLKDFLSEYPEYIGETSQLKFGNKLPFLLKVLSIKTALSIQVHPSKKEAEFLHKCAPDVYKDDNHKPELAIALTDFEALVGFRNLHDVSFFIKSIPQLGNLIGNVKTSYLDLINEEQKQAALKVCYKSLMKSSTEDVTKAVTSLVEDFTIHNKAVEYLSERHAYLADLFLRLNEQYPNDIGCFSVFLLNKLSLKPGESVYLAANLPHAYISGTIIECMACSDNVIRAGLTPKQKDVDSLINMVDYEAYEIQDLIFKSKRMPTIHEKVTRELFSPSIPDFAVEKIIVEMSETPVPIIGDTANGSILLIMEGEGIGILEADGKVITRPKYHRGNAFFLAANAVLLLQPTSYTMLFRAFANV